MPDVTNRSLLIAGSNSLLSGAIAAAVRSHAFTDVRSVHNVAEILLMLEGWTPSITVLDFEVAIADDYRVIRAIRKHYPSIHLVVLASENDDPRVLINCFIAGIRGVASKEHDFDSLLTVLDIVSKGQHAMPRRIIHKLVDNVREVAVPLAAKIQLSTRQRQILRLVAEGLTDQEIGERLYITKATVRSHMGVIFKKTSTTNRTAAARWLQTTNDNDVPCTPTGGKRIM